MAECTFTPAILTSPVNSPTHSRSSHSPTRCTPHRLTPNSHTHESKFNSPISLSKAKASHVVGHTQNHLQNHSPVVMRGAYAHQTEFFDPPDSTSIASDEDHDFRNGKTDSTTSVQESGLMDHLGNSKSNDLATQDEYDFDSPVTATHAHLLHDFTQKQIQNSSSTSLSQAGISRMRPSSDTHESNNSFDDPAELMVNTIESQKTETEPKSEAKTNDEKECIIQ